MKRVLQSMKIVFDTNVILDVISKREPFVEISAKAFDLIDRDDVTGAMTANTATDLFFLYQKRQPDLNKCKEALKRLLLALEVLDTTRALCLMAIESPMPDFEDALLVESARHWSADYIVTRDGNGFDDSPVKAISPQELLRRIGE